MTYALGVDLGTTFTAAVDHGSGTVPLKLGSNSDAMPAVLATRYREPMASGHDKAEKDDPYSSVPASDDRDELSADCDMDRAFATDGDDKAHSPSNPTIPPTSSTPPGATQPTTFTQCTAERKWHQCQN